MVLQLQLFITVELKIETLYPRMSNKSAFSMVSNLQQDNILDLNFNLWNQIPMFTINMHLVVQFAPKVFVPSTLLSAFLDLTNRTPLEISIWAFMGYPGLFQHSYICLYIIFHLNNKFCLHSSLALLDPLRGSGVTVCKLK